MRLLLFILVAAAVTFVLAYAYANHLRRSGMFFPDRYPVGSWDTSGLRPRPRDIEFTTSDGVRLHGWYFQSSASAPLMIWFHGNGGNITERGPIAAELARRGVSVFLFDWRGYGKSAGTAEENALFKDASAAYDFAAASLLPAGRDRRRALAIYGESLGGPYAAWVAKERGAACVVIENSFPSLTAVGNAIYYPLGYFAPGALTTTRWLNQAGVPVLVMHGKRDETIPFALGMQLYEGLRVPKGLLISETAGHCAIPAVEPDRFYSGVTDFITAHTR